MKLKDFTIGALIGGAAAGIAVALTTPKNGVELRADIKKEAETLYEEGRNKFDQSYELASEKANMTKENLDEKLASINAKVAELKDEAMGAVEELKTKAGKDAKTEDISPDMEVVKDEVVAELEELNEALKNIEE